METEEKGPSLVEVLTEDQFGSIIDAIRTNSKKKIMGTEYHYVPGSIPVGDFEGILAGILSLDKKDERITSLCKKIDVDRDGAITENDLISYLLQKFQEGDKACGATSAPFQELPTFKINTYSKQTPCRLISLTSPPRYITVSKDGIIATWSLSLELQKAILMDDKNIALSRNQLSRIKRTHLWITDTVVLAGTNMLVISTTSRELNFYDISMTVPTCSYRVCDVPDVPLCMFSSFTEKETLKTAKLLVGDGKGCVTIYNFHKPLTSLFMANKKEVSQLDATQLILYSKLSQHQEYVSYTVVSVHSDWIHRLIHLPHNSSLITCSSCPNKSLIIRDIDGQRKPYVFSLSKGVACFDYNSELEVLVTGSADHRVRFWNPYVPTRPVATLIKHNASVIDVLIHKDMKIVFSFSQDSVLVSWSITEHTMLQSINVKFPFSQRQLDFSSNVMTLISNNSVLTITCNEFICKYAIGAANVFSSRWPNASHGKSVIGVQYDSCLQQVVSCCEGGVINVWSLLTGTKTLCIRTKGGQATCMSLDATGCHTIIGFSNGAIKVYDMNGECVKEMITPGRKEVTAVHHQFEKSCFIAAGWNKKISIFPDIPNVFRVKPDAAWADQCQHDEDILTMSFCLPHYLATGSFDGVIIVWNLESMRCIASFKSPIVNLEQKLYRRQSSNLSPPPSKSANDSSRSSPILSPPRAASRRLSSLKLRTSSVLLPSAPVSKVMFLQQRLKSKDKHRAVLVSTDNGCARFWSLHQQHEPKGSISLIKSEDETVLALATDEDNQYLISGDSRGDIVVVNISTFCNGLQSSKSGTPPEPVARWHAHAEEILALQCVSYKDQVLVLSGAGDYAVRLWSIKGSYIGAFGQKEKWDLSNPTTFQHPKTPWEDDRQRRASNKPTNSSTTPRLNSLTNVLKGELQQEGSCDMTETEAMDSAIIDDSLKQPSSSSCGSDGSSIPSITDTTLPTQYASMAKQRLTDKQDRRQFAEVDVKATERFGLISSPFQALHLTQIADIKIPQKLSELQVPE